MTSIFLLRHLEEQDENGVQGYKEVGAYSTAEKAREAIGRYSNLPGFKDYPERWAIVECVLDQPDEWAEGFDLKTHQRIER